MRGACAPKMVAAALRGQRVETRQRVPHTRQCFAVSDLWCAVHTPRYRAGSQRCPRPTTTPATHPIRRAVTPASAAIGSTWLPRRQRVAQNNLFCVTAFDSVSLISNFMHSANYIWRQQSTSPTRRPRRVMGPSPGSRRRASPMYCATNAANIAIFLSSNRRKV